MLFNSIEFLIFFPIVIAGFFLLPHRFRRYFLLAASCYFYMSFIPKYIFILLFTTLVDYFGALGVEKAREIGNRKLSKACFLTAVLLNVGLLVFFKYLGLLEDTINFFGHMIDMKTVVLPDVVLPIGISFHTFQSMGYLIDVFMGKEKAEKSFIDFALFLMFFPQLVAGPIERSSNLFSQLKEEHFIKYENFSYGGKMMLWGMFKKVVVADNLAMFADAVFNNVESYSGGGLILGILAFTIQIYCDFSGYSDIAIGAAKCMDINLMKNFDTPYFSRSVPEFWRRWHISLSTWFKDYVYIPMGGNRVPKLRWALNILTVWMLTGLWHGAEWTFVLWGLYFAFFLVLEKALARVIAKIPPVLNRILVLFIVMISFMIFDSPTISEAFRRIVTLFDFTNPADTVSLYYMRSYAGTLAAAIIGATPLLRDTARKLAASESRTVQTVMNVLVPVFVCAVLIVSTAYLVDGSYNPFLYFRF